MPAPGYFIAKFLFWFAYYIKRLEGDFSGVERIKRKIEFISRFKTNRINFSIFIQPSKSNFRSIAGAFLPRDSMVAAPFLISTRCFTVYLNIDRHW